MQAREIKESGFGEKSVYKDADKALEFLRDNGESEEGGVVAVDEGVLVRKIDWMVVPIMFACYFLQYLDKSLCKCCFWLGVGWLLTGFSEFRCGHGD